METGAAAGAKCLSPALARRRVGRCLPDAATASNFAAPDAKRRSPDAERLSSRCRPGVCLKSSSRAGKRFRPPAYGDSVSAQRSTGSRVPEAATASRFTALDTSVFHRLRPDVGLGADTSKLWVMCRAASRARSGFLRLRRGDVSEACTPTPRLHLLLPPQARSAFRRLRPGAVLGTNSPMLSAPCGAEVPPAKRVSPASAWWSVGS